MPEPECQAEFSRGQATSSEAAHRFPSAQVRVPVGEIARGWASGAEGAGRALLQGRAGPAPGGAEASTRGGVGSATGRRSSADRRAGRRRGGAVRSTAAQQEHRARGGQHGSTGKHRGWADGAGAGRQAAVAPRPRAPPPPHSSRCPVLSTPPAHRSRGDIERARQRLGTRRVRLVRGEGRGVST